MTRCLLAAAAASLALTAVGSQASAQLARVITIGVLADCSGPFSHWYAVSVAGLELPLVERGAKPILASDPASGLSGASIAGHPVRLVFGCSDVNALPALIEARRLVESLHADIVIGPSNADEENALEPYMRRHPEVTFVDGSARGLIRQAPANYFRFHGDGRQAMAGLGSYAFNHLGWRTLVVLANPTNYDWMEIAGFEAEFCALGGSIVKRIWFNPGTTDFTAVLSRIPRRGVDGFFIESFTKIEQSLVANYPGLSGNSTTRILGGVFSWPSPPPNDWWRNVPGQVLADASGAPPASVSFAKRLHNALPHLVRTAKLSATDALFAGDFYSGIAATTKALEKVHGDLSHDEQRFQHALARVQIDGPTGHVRLDADHQGIVSNFLWRLNKPNGSDRTLIRVVNGVDRTFGGYYANEPPPSESTPVCRKGHVPPWARSG